MKHKEKYYLIIILSISSFSFSQKKKNILNTNNSLISIRENNYLYKNIWEASSETKLDVFVPNKFNKEQKITFYSDIDSISFIIKPQNKYNFTILINGKKKAHTQINTYTNQIPSIEQKLIYKKKINSNKIESDTIPFKIGNDNGIHIDGKINNSEILDFYFDTGAGMNVITSSLINTKVILSINGSIENKGSDGVTKNETSSNNQIEIKDLLWDNVKLLSTNYKNLPFDVVLSWTAFETKIVEIDYEKKILIIHEKLENISNEYAKSEMKMIDGIPYIKCKLFVEGKENENWFIFDSGSDGNLMIGNKFDNETSMSKNLTNLGIGKSKGSAGKEFKQIKVSLPKLEVGNFVFYNVPTRINEIDPIGSGNNEIIGNNILKRFNTILDFQNNIFYLKPNKLFYTTLE